MMEPFEKHHNIYVLDDWIYKIDVSTKYRTWNKNKYLWKTAKQNCKYILETNDSLFSKSYDLITVKKIKLCPQWLYHPEWHIGIYIGVENVKEAKEYNEQKRKHIYHMFIRTSNFILIYMSFRIFNKS